MQRPAPRLLALSAAIAAAALAVASCATSTSPGTSPAAPATASPSSSGQPAPTSTSQAAPTASPVSCPGNWQTGPVSVAHQVAVPPVPVATAIRPGTHPECRFDRLVIDISGSIPGYSARFVSKVIQDASGKQLTLPGSRYLVIRLEPAQGHDANGTATLPSGVKVLTYPMLKGYTVSGDFEGVLSIALGLAGGVRYRVGELPGRIYVDVRW